MKKGQFVKDIKVHMKVRGIFAVKMSGLNMTRKGEPFWALTLVDCSGAVEAKIWPPLSSKFDSIPPGELALAQGRAEEFKGAVQINLENFEPLGSLAALGANPAEYMPSSPYDIDEMFDKLEAAIIREFIHAPWQDFIKSIFHSPDIRENFKLMPAARSLHHAYAGGLLEHTLNVFELCRLICARYPELDRQTLLAGALLHDIGKISEFSGGIANDYTQAGHLLGHIFLGLEIVAPFLARSDLSPGLQEHLRHLIISHHGQLEFGSPKLPQTAEALALHYADNLDAKLAQCRNLFNPSIDRPSWSSRQPGLDRAILLPENTPSPINEEAPPMAECDIPPFLASEMPEYEEGYLDSLASYEDDYYEIPDLDTEIALRTDKAEARREAEQNVAKKDMQCSLL